MTLDAGVRVVHVTPHYPPFIGGAEKVVEALAVSRRARGLEVSVLTSLDRDVSGGDSRTPDFVQRLPSWEVANTSIIPGLLGRLLRLPRRSIIHLHIARAFVPEMVYAAYLLRRIPYVAHLHLDVGPSGWAGFMLHVYKPLILGRVLRSAAVVVVFNDEQQSDVASRYGINPARIRAIPNGVDENFRDPGPRLLHPRPRLLFVGRLSLQKNLPLLFHALDGISDGFETTLVGEGKLEDELKAAVNDLHLRNVRFYGRADGAELRELYRNADVFVLPSEREGMPLVLLEALAMGLPVVATDIPGNRDIILDGHNGALTPLGDPSAFRQALLNITGDPDTYRRMSEASRRLAEKYSWETASAEFDRLYANITNYTSAVS
jgi:glycosyltransferase involved in cell wall biosynthesis